MPERSFTPTPERSTLAYDIQFDIEDYQILNSRRPKISPEEFTRKKIQLDQLKIHNLQTTLGERFNAQVLQITYHLINGQLFNTDHDEPFLEIIKRGQIFRENNNSQDVKREKAEVTGFTKVQEILNDPNFEGKIIIISPKGDENSIYQHNFFDVCTKNENGTITMSRYNCKLSYQEFYEAANLIDHFNNLLPNSKDSDFLENPLLTYKSLKEIHEILHQQEETLSLSEYKKLLEACTPLIIVYISALTENHDAKQIARIYNSILNYADEFFFKEDNRPTLFKSTSTPQLLYRTIEYFAKQTVRQVAGGCGIQSGFSTSSLISVGLLSPYSVAEFGLGSGSCENCGASEGHFHCPGCGGKITSGMGITTCPHCGLTKEEAGSKCA